VSDNKPSPGSDAVVVIVILARVFVMLAIWLAVFLAIFLGYFTVPFLLISVITAIYLITDLGLFVTLKRRRKAISERQKFIESNQDESTQEDK
jgi:hypothetical protein